MKEKALKLADELDEASKLESDLNRPENEADFQKASAMIRRLVEELDKQEMETARVRIQFVSVADENNRLKNQLDKQQVWCDCGDGITPDCGAICGNCLASMNTTPQTKPLSDEEIDWFIDDIVDAIGLNNDCMEEEWYARGRNVVKAVLERHGIK